MKTGIAKFTAFCLAAGMTLGEGGAVYFASPTTTLVGTGEAASDEAAQTETETENAASETSDTEETAAAGEEVQTQQTEEAQTAVDTSMVGTTGFAQCESYLNVRVSGDSEGEVVGKIYNNGSMEILDVDENGWYYVRSGNVEGYVAGQFVATGSAASQIADTAGYTTAEVGVETLNVRADASTDYEVVTTVSGSAQIEVVEDQGEWVKVVLEDGTYGYVSHDYVNTSTAYATGETVEEEQERLDEQWLAYLAAQEAASYTYTEDAYTEAYTTDSSYSEYTDYSSAYTYVDTSAYDEAAAQAQAVADAAQAAADAAYAQAQSTSYTDTGDLEANAQAAYAAYLEAQAAADAALENYVDEQTVNDTCAAAQAAYAAYVAAQDEADEAAAGITNAQTSADELQAAADQAAQEAAAAQAAADQAAQEAAYAQTQTTEETYQTTETYEETSIEETQTVETYSSAGQSVADYATQFVGNPYVWGGASLTSGADCSGFTMAVYANFGISLPHNAAEQSGYGTAVSLDSLQPGDLIFYGDGISHVALYIGGGQVVHASNPTNGILISSYNYRTPVCARRYL